MPTQEVEFVTVFLKIPRRRKKEEEKKKKRKNSYIGIAG